MSTAAGRQYNLWARVYDTVWQGYTERTLSELLDRAKIGPEDRVLDVGCGTGALEAMLVEMHPHQTAVGVDVSERMLDRAREKLAPASGISYRRADAHRLPFPDEAFDVVISASAFHYFPDPTGALGEMRRVARPDGRVYILDWDREHPLVRARDAVLRIIDPPYVSAFTATEMRETARGAGLETIQIETFRSRSYGLFVAEMIRV